MSQKNKYSERNRKLSQVLFWIDDWMKGDDIPHNLNDLENRILKDIKNNWFTEDRLSMLDALYSLHGDVVYHVINKFLKMHTVRDWENIAKDSQDNSLDSFVKALWLPLKDQGFEYTQEQQGDTLQFKVTRCPIADLAKELHGEKWIHQLVCLGDYYMVEGFNENIQFTRDKTIPTGFDHCNHTYRMKE